MTMIQKNEHAKILVLFYKKGLNKAEIARMYGVSRERIRQILARYPQRT